MATRRYHKKRVDRKSRKMHGGKLFKKDYKTPLVLLGTKINDVLSTIDEAIRSKDNIKVYTIKTDANANSVTWEFNDSYVASLGKGAAFLGSLVGASRSVLQATKENINRIYNGNLNSLDSITSLPKTIKLTPTSVSFDETKISIKDTNNPIDLKTAIFYFYFYLQD